jgi:TolB protein
MESLTPRLRPFCVLLFFLITAHSSPAQQKIEIPAEADSARLIPVSLAGFSGEVQSVLKFDLEVTGCQIVAEDAAQYNISGSNNGQVEGKLVDRINNAALLPNRRYTGGALRSQAHAFADDIVLKLTGKPGIARTRIAFKSEAAGKTEIYLADYDGANATAVTQDGSLVAAPCWGPGRRFLFYTSYKSGWPDIYSQEILTGERRVIAKHPGLNTSAAVSPDGTRPSKFPMAPK